jgi:CRISPR-associated protein Cmr3
MTIWLVEPRDPLIVREGRPFGPDPGASATSLPFPFPSTLAGGVRSRSALDENGAFHYERAENMSPEYRQKRDQLLEHLKKIRIRGPLLVLLADENDDLATIEHEGKDLAMNTDAWLVPMPNDAQLFALDSKDEVFLRRLVPLILPSGAQTDFDQAGTQKQLWLVGLESVNDAQPRKPLSHKLRYWHWKHFQTWLTNPQLLENEQALSLSSLTSSLGYEDLIRDYRLHVSMDSEKEMGKEGQLFGTSGLEFTHPGKKEKRLHDARRLALALDVEDQDFKTTPLPGVAGLAGERRIVTWRQSKKEFPVCPDDIKKAIKSNGYCRLVLLTPASFAQGYYPSWLHTTHAKVCGVEVKPQAIAVRRPQVVSGWDLALGRPKPSRRLAPAGTVLFLSVQGSDAALDTWIEQTWMQCISDDEQDRSDGFGLAVLGTWSGKPVAMQ